MQFRFGKNWRSYVDNSLNLERVAQARREFASLLRGIELKGRSFLDIGFGQGLSLTAAREMGADVLGIDIDPDSIEALRRVGEVMGQHALPEVRIGSILDEKLVEDLERNGGFDIVHSWGVLHHTGDMRKAIHQACRLVNQGGYFVCAIYRSHWSSPLWRLVKRGYNTLPRFLQPVLVILLYPVIFAAKWVATGSWPLRQRRGMDFYHNVVDWVGGYPYEYATVAQIEAIMSREGLVLKRVIPSNVPTGCNEFVFYKPAPPE